eukprot:scaffold11726_cov112-Cylindrotheca_fusiformis.AAC.1
MYTEATKDSGGNDSDSDEGVARNIMPRSVADSESQQLYGRERSSRRNSGSTDNTVARTFDDERIDQVLNVTSLPTGTSFMPLANEIQGQTNLFISASHPQRERTVYSEGMGTNAAANTAAVSSLVGNPAHHLPVSTNQVPQQQVDIWQQIVLQQQRHEQQLQHLHLTTMRNNQRFSAGDLGASMQNQVQEQEDQRHLQQIKLQLQQQDHSLMPHLERSIHSSIKQRGASITPPDLQNAIPGVSLETAVPNIFAASTLPRLPAASLPTFQLSTPHRGQTFPMKLHRILCDPFFHDSIAWLPDGKSWRILNQERFVDMLAHRQYFKHSNFQSFMRQVNGWGFKRLNQGPDLWSYKHKGRSHVVRWDEKTEAARNKKHTETLATSSLAYFSFRSFG